MLKILNLRNFSKTSSIWLRQQVASEPEIPQSPIESVEESKSNLKINRLKRNSKELDQLVNLLTNKRKISQDKQIIVEGNKLIKEAVEAHIKLNKLVFSDFENVKDVLKTLGQSTSNIEFLKVPRHDLSYYSVLTTCPGLIGIFDKPQPNVKYDCFDINVICDNVREPQNLGAMIRVSNALPIKRMLLPKGSVDPWETKAIRGSSGSVFHLPIQSGLYWEEITQYEDSLVLIADNNISKYDRKAIINYDRISKDLIANKQITVIIGGETHGISAEALMFAKQRDYRVVNIPVDETVNSLNVATALGIILFELRRILIN